MWCFNTVAEVKLLSWLRNPGIWHDRLGYSILLILGMCIWTSGLAWYEILSKQGRPLGCIFLRRDTDSDYLGYPYYVVHATIITPTLLVLLLHHGSLFPNLLQKELGHTNSSCDHRYCHVQLFGNHTLSLFMSRVITNMPGSHVLV